MISCSGTDSDSSRPLPLRLQFKLKLPLASELLPARYCSECAVLRANAGSETGSASHSGIHLEIYLAPLAVRFSTEKSDGVPANEDAALTQLTGAAALRLPEPNPKPEALRDRPWSPETA